MNKKLFPLHKWPHQLDYISLINKDEKYYCYYCFGACSITKSGLEYFFFGEKIFLADEAISCFEFFSASV